MRSDIYSLGVLLYHLVTGGYPVQATSLEDLRQAHATDRRRRLTDVRPDLPEDFVRVVQRATDSDPAKRFASTGALADALSQTLTLDTWGDATRAEAESARPDADRPEPQGFARFVGARGLWLAAIAACLAIGAAIWAWPRGSTSPGERSPSTRAHAIRLAVRASDAGEPSLTSLLRDQVAQDLAVSSNLRMIAPGAVEALRDRPPSALLQSLEADALVDVSGMRENNGIVGSARVARGRQ